MAFNACRVFFDVPGWSTKHEIPLTSIQAMVENNGGLVVEEVAEATHILREFANVSNLPTKQRCPQGIMVCGVFWIFGCLEAGYPLSVASSSHYCPWGVKEPVEKAADSVLSGNCLVSCTGFSGSDRKAIQLGIEAIGGKFSKEMHLMGELKARCLIAKDMHDASAKIKAAYEHGIPVVNYIWLLDCLSQRRSIHVSEKSVYQDSILMSWVFEDDVVKDSQQEHEDNVAIAIPASLETDDVDGVSRRNSDVLSQGESIQEDTATPSGLSLGVSDVVVEAEETSNGFRDDGGYNAADHGQVQRGNEGTHDIQSLKSQFKERIRKKDSSRKRKLRSPAHSEQKNNTTEQDMDTNKTHADGSIHTPLTRSQDLSQKNLKMKTLRTMPQTAAWHVGMSSMHSDEQQICIKALRGLDIHFTSGSHTFEESFTHIIAPSIKRNQKCLCALAAGLWVVKPSYFTDSYEKARPLLNMEAYEVLDGDSKLNTIDNGVARGWRRLRLRTGKRAFEGLAFCVVNITHKDLPSRNDIRSIIRAGGGALKALSDLNSNDYPNCDIIVTRSASEANLKDLAKQKGAISTMLQKDSSTIFVTSEYLINWITKPDVSLDPEIIHGVRNSAVISMEMKHRSNVAASVN